MYIVLGITVVVFFVLIRLYVVFQDKINFYTVGSDEGFLLSEIHMLWKLAKETGLDDPMSLYVSMPTVNMAIAKLLYDSRKNGKENDPRTQNFLSHLYNFRTKINLAHDNKKGLESTRYLNNGQKLRIVLRGHGVFASQIVNNGRDITIKTPAQNNVIKISGDEWVGKTVIVYLWRKGDAHYVFDSKVTSSGTFNSQPVISLAQTTKLLRSQKRKSVRAACEISADLFFLEPGEVDYNSVDTGGYKCLLEDISEDGALIRVGGRGANNVRIKLQFMLGDTLVMMFGIVRAVEFNKDINQSRLHFECMHLEKDMKNAILSYVYDVLPQNERDELEAIAGTEEDEGIDQAEADEQKTLFETAETDGDTPLIEATASETEEA
ncbi:MAG: PilZ domain-containing protein [Treponema sp.]|nr:PilZ domain-containing protein [Treponema sp.]